VFYNPTRDLFTISQISTKNGYLKIRRGLFFSVLGDKKKKLQKQKNLKGGKFLSRARNIPHVRLI